MKKPGGIKKAVIIAEIGLNHNGDMDIAKKLIRSAKDNGADVAKFQAYDVDSIFDKDFEWYKEVKRAQLDFEGMKMLKEECDRIGIEFLASVFDVERVGWAERIGMKRYKVASRSIYNKTLIDAIRRTGKDMIVALGMYKGRSFPVIRTKGRVDFLYCVSKYPTEPSDLDFSKIDFNKYAGFSDHTIGIEASIVAMARGARIIEKHFTLDKGMYGPDHKGSMDPADLKAISNHAIEIGRILH